MEQASIWCFFSIAQISVMLFLIRETLLVNWSKDNISVFKSSEKKKSEKALSSEEQLLQLTEDDFKCRDFINCEYCNAEKKIFLKRRAALLEKRKSAERKNE
jgi:hypothetical protein